MTKLAEPRWVEKNPTFPDGPMKDRIIEISEECGLEAQAPAMGMKEIKIYATIHNLTGLQAVTAMSALKRWINQNDIIGEDDKWKTETKKEE